MIRQTLDATYNGVTSALSPSDDDDMALPQIEYVEYPRQSLDRVLPSCVAITLAESEEKGEEMPELNAWLAAIAGPDPSWLRALLTCAWIVQGTRRVPNYVRDVMRPRPGRRVIVELLAETSAPASVEISVEEGGLVSLSIFHSNGHVHRVRDFYADMCIITSLPTSSSELDGTFARQMGGGGAAADDRLEFKTAETIVDRESVAEYCCVMSTGLSVYPPNSEQALDVPMEYVAVLAAPSIVQALVSQRAYCGLLSMRQTESQAELTLGAEPLLIGQSISCTTRIVSVSSSSSAAESEAGGTIVVLRSSLHCGRMVSSSPRLCQHICYQP
ncbi:fatty acid synthase alpha subunit Lsd1 [Coemansia sp. RSA 2681]|nr:fatty acid synthase alpha subunit Lsd1 [Coemansia sp. RSA 2681]